MKIAILSDSHHKDDLTLEAISYLKTKGAKYLIHAGDLIMEENLKILQKSNLPYIAVFGNNDYNDICLYTCRSKNLYPISFSLSLYIYRERESLNISIAMFHIL